MSNDSYVPVGDPRATWRTPRADEPQHRSMRPAAKVTFGVLVGILLLCGFNPVLVSIKANATTRDDTTAAATTSWRRAMVEITVKTLGFEERALAPKRALLHSCSKRPQMRWVL